MNGRQHIERRGEAYLGSSPVFRKGRFGWTIQHLMQNGEACWQ